MQQDVAFLVDLLTFPQRNWFLDVALAMRQLEFTAVKILVEVFWVMTPCSVVVRYQRFGGPCCVHLQVEDSSRGLLSCDTVRSSFLRLSLVFQNTAMCSRPTASFRSTSNRHPYGLQTHDPSEWPRSMRQVTQCIRMYTPYLSVASFICNLRRLQWTHLSW
jgi:hypothetical protein